MAAAISEAAKSAATYIVPSQEFGSKSSMSSVWCWRPERMPLASGSQRSGFSGLQAYSIARFTFGQSPRSQALSPESFQSR